MELFRGILGMTRNGQLGKQSSTTLRALIGSGRGSRIPSGSGSGAYSACRRDRRAMDGARAASLDWIGCAEWDRQTQLLGDALLGCARLCPFVVCLQYCVPPSHVVRSKARILCIRCKSPVSHHVKCLHVCMSASLYMSSVCVLL